MYWRGACSLALSPVLWGPGLLYPTVLWDPAGGDPAEDRVVASAAAVAALVAAEADSAVAALVAEADVLAVAKEDAEGRLGIAMATRRLSETAGPTTTE